MISVADAKTLMLKAWHGNVDEARRAWQAAGLPVENGMIREDWVDIACDYAGFGPPKGGYPWKGDS